MGFVRGNPAQLLLPALPVLAAAWCELAGVIEYGRTMAVSSPGSDQWRRVSVYVLRVCVAP